MIFLLVPIGLAFAKLSADISKLFELEFDYPVLRDLKLFETVFSPIKG